MLTNFDVIEPKIPQQSCCIVTLDTKDKGIKHLEKAIKLKPDFAEALELYLMRLWKPIHL